MTRRILATLKDMDENRRARNKDKLILIVGPRGAGKSNLALWAASQIITEENIRIVNTPHEFLTTLNEIPRYGVVVYDEGLRGLMNRQAMSTENIEQIKAFAQMRQNKNLIVFVVTQDWQMMEKHVRFTACNGIFRCTFKNGGMQGLVLGYGPRALKKIKVKEGLVEYPTPNWVDDFPSIANTVLWKKYERMEGEKKVQSTLEGINRIEEKHKPKKTEQQIEKEIRMRDYFMQLRKRRLSLRRMEALIKKKFGEGPNYSTLYRWLKK